MEGKGPGICRLVGCHSMMWAFWPLVIGMLVGGIPGNDRATGHGLQKGSPRPVYAGKMLLFIQTEGAPRPYLYLMTPRGRREKYECGDGHKIIAADNESIVLATGTTGDCTTIKKIHHPNQSR